MVSPDSVSQLRGISMGESDTFEQVRQDQNRADVMALRLITL